MKCLKIFFACLCLIREVCFANSTTESDLGPDIIGRYAESPQWHKLLHLYKGKPAKRFRPDSRFYMTEGPFKDAKLELQTTLDNFRSPENYIKKYGHHPQCLFPARWRVLQRDLHHNLEKVACPEFERWQEEMRSDQIVLAFASQFISHPGSIMGHTFLKLQNHQVKDYLNRTVGYAADIPDDESALRYVYRGLFGGFNGVFSQQPYYEKVHEYNNMESRDIWEYSLKISSEEKEIFLSHLWELQGTGQFDYYYLDENCAFMILAALDPAIPEKDILDDLAPYILPIETAKALDKKGLIEKTVWRPSLRTQLFARLETLSKQERKNMIHALESRSVSEVENPVALDAILDEIERTKIKMKGELPKEMLDFQGRALVKRAQKGIIEPVRPLQPPSLLRGHGPFHIESAFGRRGNRDFFSLRFRPFMHVLMDSDVGYLENSAMSLMEIDWRWSLKESQNELHELVFFNLELTHPFSDLEPSASWKLLAHYRDKTYAFEPAAGIDFEISKGLNLMFLASGIFESNQEFEKGSRVWPGVFVQMIYNHDHQWKWVHSVLLAREMLEENKLTMLRTFSEARYHNLWSQVDVGLEYRRYDYFDRAPSQDSLFFKVIHDF